MIGSTFYLLAAAQLAVVLAAPSPYNPYKVGSGSVTNIERREIHELQVLQARKATVTVTATVTATAVSAATTPVAAAADEDEETKTKSNGTLNTATTLRGNNELQAVAFAGSSGVGAIEIEYQDPTARTLTVVENKTPAAAPAGFVFADTSSYIVSLAEGAANVTRQQIDYTFDITNATIAAKNLTSVRTGKLCADASSFVISTGLGTQDFEADEGESTFLVSNIVGEWAVFFPSA